MAKRGNTANACRSSSLSTQLLAIEVPMIAVFIIAVAVIVFVNARSGLIEEAQLGLENESKANANDIGGEMTLQPRLPPSPKSSLPARRKSPPRLITPQTAHRMLRLRARVWTPAPSPLRRAHQRLEDLLIPSASNPKMR